MAQDLPGEVEVVIVGGGVVGCSLAYHLTQLGMSDVLLLERRQLTCGTTWHAAGLVGQLRATLNLTRLAQYTAELYAGLEAETGQATGFRQHGSLSLATTAERLEELRRGASMAKTFGLAVEEVSPAEAQALHPLLNVDDVVGCVFLPKDGQTNPVDTTLALAKGARAGGATIREGIAVTGVLVDDGRAAGVRTASGDVAARIVVNCAGMWGRELGRMAGVAVPLQACEHYYVVTEEIPGLKRDLPVLRDPDHCAYVKEDAGKLLVGAFERNARAWALDGIPPDFCFDELPEDWEHFLPVLESQARRLPVLQEAGIRTFFCGPESFTPDVRYLLGEAPELPGFYLACGFNSIGIQSAGGAGKVLAEWIRDGHPPMDLWDVDIRRLQPFQAAKSYLADRAPESLGLLYAMHWPHLQPQTARDLRLSPLHMRMQAAGACFGETAGWERPLWYAPAGVAPVPAYSYGRQNWFPHVAAECRAVRETVALFDQSPFAKFSLQGPEALAVLQRICANDVAVPPGRIVYTQWLNPRGGIEADLTVARIAEDLFWVVTGAAVARRDWTWLARHLPEGAGCCVTDITSGWAVLGLAGPASRALLQAVAEAPERLDAAACPFGHWVDLTIGAAPVRAMRLSYAGELGWELYVPSEFAISVFDRLQAAGPGTGLRLAGLHAMESCRLEKGFRHWGHDIGDEDTPLEAGLDFAVAIDRKPDFIGRDALLRQRDAGVTRRLVQFRLQDPEPLLYHNEPIWRDGRIAGYLTSGGYGHSLGAAVGMGYLHDGGGPVDPGFVAAGTYEIEIAGRRFPAAASLRPFHDPAGRRMRD
ncbi:MAG: FAD-dependent oxidoreductase [Sneathiellaceae bacterium]